MPNVNDNFFMGMVKLLLLTSTIFCHEGKPRCGLRDCEGGLIDSIYTVNPYALHVIVERHNEYPGPFHGFEGIIWISALHDGRHGSFQCRQMCLHSVCDHCMDFSIV